MTPAQARLVKEISEVSLALHARGWVANHDGNVSARIDAAPQFFITPTGVSKRLCTPQSIVRCDGRGKPLDKGRPPSEVALHVGIYGARKDVQAVLHAHPPYASAFALARRRLEPVCMPEVLVSLGEHIPLMPLVLPKDPAAEGLAAEVVASADVALMAGNGALSVGPDLETAFLRMELLEHYCRILSVLDAGVGKPAPLSASERAHLLDLRMKAGLHRGPPPSASAPSGVAQPDLRSVVAEEIRRALGEPS